jgi:hypothetical protein
LICKDMFQGCHESMATVRSSFTSAARSWAGEDMVNQVTLGNHRTLVWVATPPDCHRLLMQGRAGGRIHGIGFQGSNLFQASYSD